MTLEPAAPPPPPPWRIRDAVVALVAGVAASVVGALPLFEDGISVREAFTVVLPLQSMGTMAAAWWMARRRGGLRAALGLKWRWSDLVGFAVGAGIQVALAAVALAVVETFFNGEVPGRPELVTAADETVGLGLKLLVVLGLVVIGPLAEEVVFRGMLLSALLPAGRRRAVIITSVVFALIHLVDPAAAFSVPFLFVLALVLANERLRTGALGRPIAIHAGFNAVTVIALLAS